MELREFTQSDIPLLLKWLEDIDERFLYQFAGPKYNYPLTKEQLIETIGGIEYRPFKFLDGKETVGHCQFARLDRDNKEVTLGRLLISPDHRGKGYGLQMIKKMIEYGDSTWGLKSFKLVVFDFNKSAIKCYEKAGFKLLYSQERFVEKFNEIWIPITMEFKIL